MGRILKYYIPASKMKDGVRVYQILFGYKSKYKDKTYNIPGLIGIGGKPINGVERLGKGLIRIPTEDRELKEAIERVLKSFKIEFRWL